MNPFPLRRWHVLAFAIVALLAYCTADPTDCDGKRCSTYVDAPAQTR